MAEYPRYLKWLEEEIKPLSSIHSFDDLEELRDKAAKKLNTTSQTTFHDKMWGTDDTRGDITLTEPEETHLKDKWDELVKEQQRLPTMEPGMIMVTPEGEKRIRPKKIPPEYEPGRVFKVPLEGRTVLERRREPTALEAYQRRRQRSRLLGRRR